MRDRLAAFFQGKVGLHGGHVSAVLPVDGAVDHAAHFAEPELSDLTPLLAPTGRPMRFRIFERDFQLFFHMPSNLRGWVGHMLSKGSLFLGRFDRQNAGGGAPELQPIDRSKPFRWWLLLRLWRAAVRNFYISPTMRRVIFLSEAAH